MSELTNALNRIRACLESNYSAVATQLPPGLSMLKIEETFQPLPYKLPQEVYELYQWCRGWNGETENWDTVFAPYYYMTLCSPQRAIQLAKYFDSDEGEFESRFDEVSYLGKPIFPIFSYNLVNLCIVADWQEKHPSPVVFVLQFHAVELEYISLTTMMQVTAEAWETGVAYIDEEGFVELEYISLTTMMQVTAEAWETGVAYIDEEGFVECDEQKFFAIYRQHNSELPQMVLARLKQELEIAGSDPDKLHNTWDSISENIHSLTKCWSGLTIDQFQPELIEPIVTEMNKKDESRYSFYAKQILEKLKYRF